MSKKIELSQDQIALVDNEDYEWLNQWKWSAAWDPKMNQYYAVRTEYIGITNGKQVQKSYKMHRLIMDVSEGLEVDHINHDTLDNRRSNLRIVTSRENKHNYARKTTSNYPGVHWNSRDKLWVAKIQINGKDNYLGGFKSERKAAIAYQNAFKKLKENIKEDKQLRIC